MPRLLSDRQKCPIVAPFPQLSCHLQNLPQASVLARVFVVLPGRTTLLSACRQPIYGQGALRPSMAQ